jgi:hypothetical protein
MYIHDNGVIFTSIFALMAKIAPNHDALLDRLIDYVPLLNGSKSEWL